MKSALKQMVEADQEDRHYYLSIVEKENESGIMFNTRILFLQAGSHIGYISQVNMQLQPSQVKFNKSKSDVKVNNMNNISINEKLLVIKFKDEDNKKIEKTWIFRFETEELTRSWNKKLREEKVNYITKKKQSQKKTIPTQSEIVKKSILNIKKQYGISYSGLENRESAEQRRYVETGIGSSKILQIEEQRQQTQKEVEIKKKLTYQSKFNDSNLESPIEIIQKDSSRKKIESSYSENQSHNCQKVYEKKYSKESLSKKESDFALRKNISIKSSITNAKYLSESDELNQNDQPNRYYEMTSEVVKNTKFSEPALQKPIRRNLGFVTPSSETNGQQYLDVQNEKNQVYKKSSSSSLYKDSSSEIIESNTNRQKSSYNLRPNQIIIQEEQNAQQRNQTEYNDFSNEKLPWTYKYIRSNELIFNEFRQYCEPIFNQIISEFHLPQNSRKFKPRLSKEDIYHFNYEDIEIKLSFINLESLEGTVNSDRVCNKSSVKMLQNEFKNYEILYKHLMNSSRLRVPLVVLIEMYGFTALFKAISKKKTDSNTFRNISKDLETLKQVSKIDHNFTTTNNMIIRLDEDFYNGFKNKIEFSLNFNCYIIQQIDEFLLKDRLDGKYRNHLVLREELIETYAEQGQIFKNNLLQRNVTISKLSSVQSNYNLHIKELESFSKNVVKAITDCISEVENLQVYFINSKELASYFHKKGINLRYLGAIYENLKSGFPRKIVMTEIAARICKNLFKKTIQDIIFDQGLDNSRDFIDKVCDFFNCVLGNTYETAAIWKVLAIHCQNAFGTQLNFDEIYKEYFVLALIQNCRLEVNWERLRPQDIFKTNIFFNQINLFGIKNEHKIFKPIYNNDFKTMQKVLDDQENTQGLNAIIELLQKNHKKNAFIFSPFKQKILKYLSCFVDPQKAATKQFRNLQIYNQNVETIPNRFYFTIKLMQIKWNLKLSNREKYVKSCDEFIKTATKYYGQFHPIFSELYDMFSAFHLSNLQYEDSITFAKSSLVNILKICGTSHQKTSECYYHLALCYIKANRKDEAICNMKKSKIIYENNNKSNSIPYAIINLKLGLLYLNQNLIQECIESVNVALQIFIRDHQEEHEDEIIEAYEVLARCFEILQQTNSLIDLSKKAYVKLPTTKEPENLQKLLKIYFYPILFSLSSQNASNYLDIISLISVETNSRTYAIAFQFLSKRVQEYSLEKNFLSYVGKMNSIEKFIRQNNMISEWEGLKNVYPRETVNDFISLTEQIMVFLGQGYLTGSLREAL